MQAAWLSRKDSKAAIRTRLAAMDAANKKNAGGSSNDMDNSTSVLDEKERTMGDAMGPTMATGENTEKRPRDGALEMALAPDLEVAEKHAQ